MTSHEGKEYDIIFCGGGTAACVVAGRLAAADPELSILIIEGGKNNLNEPTIVTPAIYLANLQPTAGAALFYQGNADKNVNGREIVVPTGGVLGGGSSINFMMYTRAAGSDFDSWKTEGWDKECLLRVAKKLENYHLHDQGIDQERHGHKGPVNISYGTYGPERPMQDFLEATEALGDKYIPDLQDFKSAGGFSRWARYVGEDGKRQDTAHRYVHALMQSDRAHKLEILTEHKVSKVLFNDQHEACGVECEPTGTTQPNIALSKPKVSTIHAKKMVVVSAGALGTPSVLERSGVGSSKVLKDVGIDVVSDLPGVGENYQDHHLLLYPYKSSCTPDETLDDLWRGKKDFVEALKANDPMLGWNAIDVASKYRPSEEEIKEMGPEFEKLWEGEFKDHPDKPLMLIGVAQAYLGDHKALPDIESINGGPMQYQTMAAYSAYPLSRGRIHITSASANTPASFDHGFFSHELDVTIHVWAYKKQREIYRRTNSYQGELSMAHPDFGKGKASSYPENPESKEPRFKTLEDRRKLEPIKYDEEDERVIADWIRSNVNTTWHSMGTCRMAPKEEGGVVDGKLNVYGTKKLKLADLSICPENVGANTNNTAIIVGERAAEIIGEELGIKV